MNKLNWIESGGGPLIFASESLVRQWNGMRFSAPLDVTDYQRACAVQNEIDTISLGKAQAIVLGDEPDRTALYQIEDVVLLIRWRWANSEESLVSALFSALSQLIFEHSGAFRTVAGEHLLFDSAYGGDEVSPSLSVELTASAFSIETALFVPDEHMCAVVHRLRPIA